MDSTLTPRGAEIRRLHLKKLPNTRDLGGLPTEDRRKIKKGKLIRSGKLYKLSKKTVDALKAIGVTTVLDLRILTEQEQHPDTLLDGVQYYHLPVLCTATPGITMEKSMRKLYLQESKKIKTEFGTADNYMSQMYRYILMSDEPQQYLKQALRLIIENEGCIIWHCSSGKDRAGILALLVESLLGVNEQVIMDDYLASNRFLRGKFFWRRVGLAISPFALNFKRILYGMMAGKSRYITDTTIKLKEQYGSVTEYCKQVLGVTDEDIEILKNKYLE